MRRGTTKAKTTALLNEFRAAVPGITLRTSLIVGYPGESEADFEELKQWVKEMRFERLGCFTYSRRKHPCLPTGRQCIRRRKTATFF